MVNTQPSCIDLESDDDNIQILSTSQIIGESVAVAGIVDPTASWTCDACRSANVRLEERCWRCFRLQPGYYYCKVCTLINSKAHDVRCRVCDTVPCEGDDDDDDVAIEDEREVVLLDSEDEEQDDNEQQKKSKQVPGHGLKRTRLEIARGDDAALARRRRKIATSLSSSFSSPQGGICCCDAFLVLTAAVGLESFLRITLMKAAGAIRPASVASRSAHPPALTTAATEHNINDFRCPSGLRDLVIAVRRLPREAKPVEFESCAAAVMRISTLRNKFCHERPFFLDHEERMGFINDVTAIERAFDRTLRARCPHFARFSLHPC